MQQSNDISKIQEEIDLIREYLYSDCCKSCGEAALRLEKCIKELSEIIDI